MDNLQSARIETRNERLWNSNYIKVMCSNFLLFFAFYILTPLLPLYLNEQFSADKDMIGVVLSGYVIATLLIRPFSGFFVDSFNRKKVLMICFFAFFILFAGYIGAGTLLMFAIVRTCTAYLSAPPQWQTAPLPSTYYHLRAEMKA